MPLHKAIFIEPGLAGAKYALSRLGRARERRALAAPPTVEQATERPGSTRR